MWDHIINTVIGPADIIFSTACAVCCRRGVYFQPPCTTSRHVRSIILLMRIRFKNRFTIEVPCVIRKHESLGKKGFSEAIVCVNIYIDALFGPLELLFYIEPLTYPLMKISEQHMRKLTFNIYKFDVSCQCKYQWVHFRSTSKRCTWSVMRWFVVPQVLEEWFHLGGKKITSLTSIKLEKEIRLWDGASKLKKINKRTEFINIRDFKPIGNYVWLFVYILDFVLAAAIWHKSKSIFPTSIL